MSSTTKPSQPSNLQQPAKRDLIVGGERFSNAMIRASAGSGKTFQLSNRYISLLATQQNPAQILASTFTRKAAGEILDRIVERLADAAIDERAAAELASHLEGVGDFRQSTAAELLGDLLRQLHRIQISTLDAFFAGLAKTLSLEIGLSPGWVIADDQVQLAIRDEAIRRVLMEEGANDMVHLLAKGEATRSIGQLIRDTVGELYTVFRGSDANAWKSLRRKTPPSDRECNEAFSRLEALKLPKAGLEKARKADLQRYAVQDWSGFISKGIAAAIAKGQAKYGQSEIPVAIVGNYETLLQSAVAILINQVVSHTQGTFRLLEQYHQHLVELKGEQGAFGFDDVAYTLAESMAGEPFAKMATQAASPIDHLLLDEFQDTSPLQWRVLREFAKRSVEPQPSRSFFVVGDMKQAIYGWRGGEAEIFDSVAGQLKHIEEAPSLNHSRRSAPIVIDAVNRVFSEMGKHANLDAFERPVQAWCKRFEPHSTASTQNGFVKLQVMSDSDDSLPEVANEIAGLHQAAPGKSIGVLTRTNKTVNELIYLLGKAGVHASEEGGNPLTDSVAVNILLSLLRWVDHPGDTVSLFHIGTSRLGRVLGLPEAHRPLAAYYRSAPGIALNDRLRRSLLEEGYAKVVADFADMLREDCSEREQMRLNQLVNLAVIWQASPTLRTTDFIQFVARRKIAEASSALVRVMTVHQSKGLEFDAVVLPDLDRQLVGQSAQVITHRPGPGAPPDAVVRHVNKDVRGLLPKKVQRWFEQYQTREIDGALCFLYVAMTRARQALYMMLRPNEKETKLPKTMAGLVRAGLSGDAPPSPGATLFQQGLDQWWIDRSSAHQQPSNDADIPPTEHDPGTETQQPAACDVDSAGEAETPVAIVAAQSTQLIDDTAREIKQGLHRFWMTRPKEELESESRSGTESGGPASVSSPRAIEVLSPSQLEGGNQVNFATLLSGKNPNGMLFGTVVHALFEQIEWLDQETPTEDACQEVAEQVLVGQRFSHAFGVNDAVSYFVRSVQTDLIRGALSKPAAIASLKKRLPTINDGGAISVRVLNEHPFVVRQGRRLLQGTIDRLELYYQRQQLVAARILDYKTDRVIASAENQGEHSQTPLVDGEPMDLTTARLDNVDDAGPSRLDARNNHYRPQLLAYVEAVKTLTGLTGDRVNAQILYVDPAGPMVAEMA